ncbi:MAG: hypothetical protein ABEJ27_00110 [Halodesulfurarchaeum sp.]
MPEPETQTPGEQRNQLFDRYLLPKVALTVILVASLLGTWVSTTLSGTTTLFLIGAKWVYFVGVGVLTGGFVWKHLFVRPADLGADAADYCAAMYDRFDRIATAAIAVVGISGTAVVWTYFDTFGPTTGLLGYVVLVLLWLAVAGIATRRTTTVTHQFRSPIGAASLVLAIAVLIATAITEVGLRGLGPMAAAVRVLHLLTFAVWIGGAVWNIFVAVPTGQHRPTVPVVRAAGQQLERFRWAVRFIIPTLLLTGLYQAGDAIGTTVTPYLGSTIGLVVLAKIASIGVLVGIFKLCPMWRACSPIDGVCDLTDLQTGPQSGEADPFDDARQVPPDD